MMGIAVRELAAGEIHVWSFGLGGPVPAGYDEDAASIVSSSERRRAEAFVFDQDRRRYLRAHVYLRRLLAGYLGVEAAKVPIRIGEHDKPRLDMHEPLGFNLTHSGDSAAIAVSLSPHVGIDLEMIGARHDLRTLARMVYTNPEQEELAFSPPDQFERDFLTLWTRKEAILKAMGVGLSLTPTELHVGLALPSRTTRVWVPTGAWGDAVDVEDVFLGDDRVAALAAAGGWNRLRVFGIAGLPPAAFTSQMPVRRAANDGR